jgi:hypothetical protein
VRVTINAGDKSLPYEPCNKQTLTMPYTLRGVGDIKDEVDFNRGVLVQRLGYVDLGTLSWSKGNKDFHTNFVTSRPMSNGVILNSHYKVVRPYLYTEYEDKTCCLSDIYMCVVDNNYTDTTSFKNAMSGVYTLYPLATPIETPLTETELNAYRQLHTNKPNTTIISEADMEISYVADTKLYIDNKIAELTALTLEV